MNSQVAMAGYLDDCLVIAQWEFLWTAIQRIWSTSGNGWEEDK